MEKLKEEQKAKIKEEIKMLLHASRDCLRNIQKNTLKIRFTANDGYYGEAFGILRTLVILKYGYFGSSNLDAVVERKGEEPWQNLKWWFCQLENEVLEEEGFYTDNVCQYCLERYGKDDKTMWLKNGK